MMTKDNVLLVDGRKYIQGMNYQLFRSFADVTPLRRCKVVVSVHNHTQHVQLLAMPKWRTADKSEMRTKIDDIYLLD